MKIFEKKVRRGWWVNCLKNKKSITVYQWRHNIQILKPKAVKLKTMNFSNKSIKKLWFYLFKYWRPLGVKKIFSTTNSNFLYVVLRTCDNILICLTLKEDYLTRFLEYFIGMIGKLYARLLVYLWWSIYFVSLRRLCIVLYQRSLCQGLPSSLRTCNLVIIKFIKGIQNPRRYIASPYTTFALLSACETKFFNLLIIVQSCRDMFYLSPNVQDI
jgi:hypothetical protein